MNHTSTLVINDNEFPCDVMYLDNGRKGSIFPVLSYPRPDVEIQAIRFSPNDVLTIDVLEGYTWLLGKHCLDGLKSEIEDHITASFNEALLGTHLSEVRYG